MGVWIKSSNSSNISLSSKIDELFNDVMEEESNDNDGEDEEEEEEEDEKHGIGPNKGES